ncbi:oligopeptide ABC transporter permease [Bacillus thermotolerans]|uniref:Oligopeptide transport system permease protein OppB n=1 Tax=Bacillus thermotolerans TaxID=1221996 RepID=A0A0F5I550_BACTR|nr:oligopeptide ABC transporter permease [Bacillus thermotolerans]KKB38125.1 Oligopeptide transport system permease protein OppB [Bacillus thermotolerans]KKB40789.1 Oligopeptide transport system permease protein OppB [Bacillus thermotolerans]KKB43214.1 Oligopeptide transport system permease protein OppB [Bacillus thermotolerans]
MARYIVQRFIYMLITLLIIATITFFLMKLLPGSPLTNQEKLSPEQQEIILDKYGLNDPLPVQYVNYMTNLFKGDLGLSFQYDNRPVTTMIGERIGPSAYLGFQAILFGTVVGIILGVLAALKQNSFLDYTATTIAVLGISIPSFVFAGVLQYFLAVKFPIFPVAAWEGFEYTVLPTLALSVFVIATVARYMRSELLEVLGSDYIMLARAKGVSSFSIMTKHALRNALIPIITLLGPLAVNIMTGSLVIENIFGIPGIGQQFVQSILTNDYTVIMGITLFYSALFIFVIFIVDILYGIIDPRIRLNGGKK